MTGRTRMARLLDAVTHTGPGYTLTPATEHPMTDRDQLHHLADRARRGVLLPAEGALLADAVAELEQRLEDWKQAAGAGMTLTDNLRAERDALAAGVPLVCSDERHKTKVFALEMRVAQAEGVIERVRQLHQPASDWSWAAFGCTHHGQHKTECPACGGCYPCATVEALDQPHPPTTTTTKATAYWRCAHCVDPITGTDWTWAAGQDPAASVWDKERFHVDRADCQTAAGNPGQPQQPAVTEV